MGMRRIGQRIATALLVALVTGGCATGPLGFLWSGKRDGEIAPPKDYRSWPRFLSTIDRHDAAQVREIYVNQVGAAARRGHAFPNDTIFVMEIYQARPHADGAPAFDPSGRLVKGPLQKLYVMAKGDGWGDGVQPRGLRNGDWIYSAFLPDGKTPAPDGLASCRGCHRPLSNRDYVHRYDEYFSAR
jgi:hemoglobin